MTNGSEHLILIQQKQLDIQVSWMPSHTADDPKKLGIAPSWMRRWHVLGNKQADLKADAGAAIDKIPA